MATSFFQVHGRYTADIERVAARFIDKGFFWSMASTNKSEAVLAGYQFEREVAAIYSALGASAEVDVGLAGSQIDVFVRELTSSGSDLLHYRDRDGIACEPWPRR